MNRTVLIFHIFVKINKIVSKIMITIGKTMETFVIHYNVKINLINVIINKIVNKMDINGMTMLVNFLVIPLNA